MGYLIFFFNNLKVLSYLKTSLIALIVELIFIVLIVKINPYRQSLRIHTVTLWINHLVYVVFLVVLNVINFVERINEIIVIAMGYFITIGCGVLVVLSMIRLYY